MNMHYYIRQIKMHIISDWDHEDRNCEGTLYYIHDIPNEILNKIQAKYNIDTAQEPWKVDYDLIEKIITDTNWDEFQLRMVASNMRRAAKMLTNINRYDDSQKVWDMVHHIEDDLL